VSAPKTTPRKQNTVENAKQRPPGKIVTFYSYKGGTGRSMSVANVAWILASCGKRVLTIDWDLEAPGLHRYFHPFLQDPDLTRSDGLIDFAVDFSIAARNAARSESETRLPSDWYETHASLLRYTHSLEWTFPHGGLIDLVPAGRQGPGYAIRVGSFDWKDFYDRLGGGVLLEAIKKQLRLDYDYVLIDSRTGVSDTAGICTVQMPDDLVVCFTLNRQSVDGAAAVAESAFGQRKRPDGSPGLLIWPVPTRIDPSEKERLQIANDRAHSAFDGYLRHLPRHARGDYWTAVQVLYQPYYAYEEVLAPFAEKKREPVSLLRSMESLTAHITRGEVTALAARSMTEEQRNDTLQSFFKSQTVIQLSRALLIYSSSEVAWAALLDAKLVQRGIEVFHIELKTDTENILEYAPEELAVIVIFIGRSTPSNAQLREVQTFRLHQKIVIPVLLPNVSRNRLPPFLAAINAGVLTYGNELSGLDRILETILPMTGIESTSQDENIDDPQKGRWDGEAEAEGFSLSAQVKEITSDWFRVRLEVRAESRNKLNEATFHLHPTFSEPRRTVKAVRGIASLTVECWGAFTVGVTVNKGPIKLELDLSEDPSFPSLFRSR
jgi:cellulose biosynthesis protein BcsQ